MKPHIKTFKQARGVSVPLIAWNTADPAASLTAIAEQSVNAPLIKWDLVSGGKPVNERAGAIAAICSENSIGDPGEFLTIVEGSPGRMPDAGWQGTCAVILNAQFFINKPPFIQGVWNLRDRLKNDGRTLILMGNNITIPAELANDILLIDEPLPTIEELGAIVCEQMDGAAIDRNDDEVKDSAKAITGMSSFAAEQAVAMSMEKAGGKYSLNAGTLWERKRKTIEATKGLTVWRGGESFADIGGVEAVKGYMRLVLGGLIKPDGIVFMDELEKSMAGSTGGDGSGTSADQLGVMLETMQDTESQGLLFVGHPGSAKSMIAKATGATAGIPTIKLDFGAMKGKHVGDSEEAIRHAVKVIGSVTDGKALYIATCNRLDSLPPELRRRFTLGTFFFDLPTHEERKAIWQLYLTKYQLASVKACRKFAEELMATVPEDGWTGADIANCCHRAWAFGIPVKDAATFATPMCKTAPDSIEELRRKAHNAFLSASYEGLYQYRQTMPSVTQPKSVRAY